MSFDKSLRAILREKNNEENYTFDDTSKFKKSNIDVLTSMADKMHQKSEYSRVKSN